MRVNFDHPERTKYEIHVLQIPISKFQYQKTSTQSLKTIFHRINVILYGKSVKVKVLFM